MPLSAKSGAFAQLYHQGRRASRSWTTMHMHTATFLFVERCRRHSLCLLVTLLSLLESHGWVTDTWHVFFETNPGNPRLLCDLFYWSRPLLQMPVLENKLYVIFRDHDEPKSLYCATSTDGRQWNAAKKVTAPGKDITTERFAGLTTLNENVLLAYTRAGSDADVYVGLSPDGESWQVSDTPVLKTFTPAVTTYLDGQGTEIVAMVYSDKGEAQMHYSSSTSGFSWKGLPDVPGKCNRPVVATLGGLVQENQGQGNLVTVYSDEHGPQLWCHSASGPNWTWSSGQQIGGQTTHNVGGLAWLPQPDSGDHDGCLVLVYQASDSRKAVTTRSWDGLTWQGTPQNELVPTPDDGYVPALVFHTASNKLVMVYQADNKLHVTFSNDGLAWETPATPM